MWRYIHLAVIAQPVQRWATGSRVRFPAGAGNFFHHRVQNGSGASYSTCSFPEGKAAGAWI